MLQNQGAYSWLPCLSLFAFDSHLLCLPLPATAAGRLLELVLLLERRRGAAVAPAAAGMKKGGKVKKMAKGGSAHSRADGIAQKGHTRGKYC